MIDIPDHIQRLLQEHLIQIARIFKAPRITLIVRGPDDGNAKGDLVLTNDNPLFVERALKAQVLAQAKILADTPQEMDVIEKEPTDGGKRPHLQCGGSPDLYQPRGRRG